MKIDKTVMILVIVLVLVVGVFALSQAGGADVVATGASKGVGYATQYAGGGCGR